jgi:pyruvate kinase
MADSLTKIIATIGPATSDAEAIQRLIEAGVSIFRLNFSHGTPEEHAARVRIIREVADELGTPTAILGDLQGPKIRVGQVAPEGIEVPTGSIVQFQREPMFAQPPPNARFSSTYAGLVDDVRPGERLLVNDGAVRMLIVERSDDAVTCTVTHGGLITSGKGINLPDSNLTIEAISERDWQHVEWSLTHGVDMLAISFVRGARDVRALAEGARRIAAELSRRPGAEPALSLAADRIPIIAKIELPQAVEMIEEILDAADGILIARGDLGVEMDLAHVPVIQKRLQHASDLWGKPCIVATQMLESMIANPAPTRAEASDVAGAIFDGADAVMLSGETAVGRYPAVAVEHMRRIALFTEAHLATLPQKTSAPTKLIESRYRTAGLAHGVWTVAQDIGAKLVVVWSQQGGGARYLSQNNFRIPIIAATTDARAARRMQVLRGVTPVVLPRPESVAHFTRMADEYLLGAGRAEEGDTCVLVAGEPIGESGVTNMLAIHRVGSPDTGFARVEMRAAGNP